MNYEKEYKKLKADIEKAYLFAQTDSTKSVLEHILPELRESEDEKARKEIISFLQLPHPQFVGERKQEKWIAWLEKQELKSNPYSGVSFNYNGNTWGMCARDNGVDILFNRKLIQHISDEKQDEQELPIEKLPKEMKTIGESLGFTTQEECDEYNKMVSDLIMSDNDKGEQKQKSVGEEIVEALRTEYEKGRADAFAQMQKEWSEEDEKTWKELIEEVKDQLDSVPSPDCRDKEDEKVLKQLTRWLVWLQFLKERYTWKPSEEQMEALFVLLPTVSYGKNPAFSLYNDLKKL